VIELRARIEQIIAAGAAADRAAARDAFVELRRALGNGDVRAAEPDASAAGGWRVNTWVKQGILLGFRVGDIVDMSVESPGDAGAGPAQAGSPAKAGRYLAFYDKDTMPLKRPGAGAGVRIVPGGSSIREGAFVSRGVICMPPMFINIGAHVGEGTMVDSHALVGSCAQVGRRVHLSAGAQIGGVIEPVGAMPVVIEDDVLVGGNTGVYEGAIVRQRAVIAAGVVITGSTPLYDLPRGVILRPEAGQPLIVPEGAVVVPGARAVSVGAGRDWGLSLATPVIVKYRDDRTDTRTELEAWIR
jgi:2,3,4,5-tetrahydropyridine-2-carboxylate N-succinyltransferase